MKKYLLILLTILFALTVLQCSNDNENKEVKEKLETEVNEFDSTDLPTSNIETPVENNSFSLAYNFDEGESFRYRLTTLSYSERNIKTDTLMSNVFDQKIIRIINFKTVSVENDSIADVECNVTNVKVDADMNGERMTYQSGESMDSSKQRKFIEYEGLINNPFNFKITRYGELLDIYKVENVTDRYLELSGIKDSVKIEEKAVFQNEIIKNLIIPLLVQIFRELPTQNLEVESTWDKVMEPAPVMVYKLQYTNHYKITDLEMLNNDRIAIINGNATTSVEGESKLSNNGINYTFQKPISKASGRIFFNLDKGMVQKSKTKTYLEIKYDMEMPSAQGILKGNSTELMKNDNILELL
jgi:Family of unknown function (DUF6263)